MANHSRRRNEELARRRSLLPTDMVYDTRTGWVARPAKVTTSDAPTLVAKARLTLVDRSLPPGGYKVIGGKTYAGAAVKVSVFSPTTNMGGKITRSWSKKNARNISLHG